MSQAMLDAATSAISSVIYTMNAHQLSAIATTNRLTSFRRLELQFQSAIQQAIAWIQLAEEGAHRIRRRVGHCIEYSLGSLCWEAYPCHFNNGVVGEGEWSLVHLVMLWGCFLGSLSIVALGNKTTHCL